MAANLVVSSRAREYVVASLKENLTHVFLGKSTSVSLDTKLSDADTKTVTSDGSSRIKELRIKTTTSQYVTENTLSYNDENRITNFYLQNGVAVNKLVFLDGPTGYIKGIITFNTITPTETKSLYVPEIKISVL